MRRHKNIAKPDDEPAPLGKGNPHTAPLDVLAKTMGLPSGTMAVLHSRGKGPPTFKVGRRVFCRVSDFYGWLDDVATGKIDATLTSKRRHLDADEVPQPRQRLPMSGRRPKRSEEHTGAP